MNTDHVAFMEGPITMPSPALRFNENDQVTVKEGARRIYKCRGCDKVFKRSEHCVRHERIHTQERPFSCQYCHKRYARKDLVKRHEKTLHLERNQLGEQPRQAGAPSSDGEESIVVAVEPAVEPLGDVANNVTWRIFPDSEHAVQAGPEKEPRPQQRSRSPQLSPHLEKQRASDPAPVFPAAKGGPTEVSGLTNKSPDDIALNTKKQHEISSLTPQIPASFPQASMPTENALGHHESIGFPTIDLLDSSVSHENGITEFADAFDSLIPAIPDGNHVSKRQKRDTGLNKTPIGLPQAQTTSDFDSFDFLDAFTFLPNVPFDHAQNSTFSSGAYDSDRSVSERSSLDLSQEGHAFSNTDSFRNPFEMTTVFHHSPQTFRHQQAGKVFEHLPRVLREKTTDLPRFSADDSTYESLCADIGSRLRIEDKTELLPKMADVQRFFTSYVDCFHRHLPILHLPSISLAETPSPLILAVCSIGALYRLDRRRALMLYHLANKTLAPALESHRANGAGTTAPLWVLQTRLLLSNFAVFSGKHDIVSACLEGLGFFSIEYRLRRQQLSNYAGSDAQMTWANWISRESSKRLLCGILIISNLLMVTYDVTPGFVATKDLMFETPDEERLWNARSEEEWRERRQSRVTTSRKLLSQVMIDMISGQQSEDASGKAYSVSGFTALVVMHAVNVHMWHMIQIIHSLGTNPFGPLPNESLSTMVYSTASSAIARCGEAIAQGRSEEHQFSWDDPEGPLIFNCQAVLRIASSRLMTNTNAFDRLILLTGDIKKIKSSIASYVAARQDRSPFLTKAVAKAYEGFLTPVKIGHLLVSKTAAFSWSVEHAIAGWDSALFLTKWVYAVEIEASTKPPTPEETHILEQLKALLVEMESEYDGNGSLAAAVAKSWASFLNDVWVWGITPQMGEILVQLSLAYEEGYQASKQRE